MRRFENRMFGQCDQAAERWDEMQAAHQASLLPRTDKGRWDVLDMGMLRPIILVFVTDKQSVMLWMKSGGSERIQWGSLAHKTMNLRVLLTFWLAQRFQLPTKNWSAELTVTEIIKRCEYFIIALKNKYHRKNRVRYEKSHMKKAERQRTWHY